MKRFRKFSKEFAKNSEKGMTIVDMVIILGVILALVLGNGDRGFLEIPNSQPQKQTWED